MKALSRIAQVAVLLMLLFVGFNWTSIRLYTHYGFEGYEAVVGGALISASLLFLLLTVVHRWIFDKLGTVRGAKWRGVFALAAVGGFSLYLVLHVSLMNVKATEVVQEYRQLHPVMRLAVSSLMLIDRTIVITDASRLPEDYKAMGISAFSRSKHYTQKDGYSHAVDIRTIDATESRNNLVKAYFNLLGFKTIRHIGTADHLHVEMPERTLTSS